MSGMSGMSGMGMGSMSGGSMASMMNMTFYNSQTTTLYSMAWMPLSQGSYAGTCIFLIILGIVYRLLVAGQSQLEKKWTDLSHDRRLVVVKDKLTVDGYDGPSLTGTFISSTGEREEVRVLKGLHHKAAHWRLSVDLPRALYTTLTAGVAYLLMLAVMTMNVGYFMSVLAGVLVGELAFGRFGAAVGR